MANLFRWLLRRDADPGQMPSEARAHVTTITVPARRKRTGLEMRFVIDGDGSEREAAVGLTRILVRAHAVSGRLLRDATLSVDEVAREENVSPSYTVLFATSAPVVVGYFYTGRGRSGGHEAERRR
jgi:hypothetical protein